MMQKLIEDVGGLVEQEYGRAGAKFGLTNHSDHESYAVILEELQEANTECGYCNSALDQFWKLTKDNCSTVDKMNKLKLLRRNAILAACEFIQVAAMAQKATITICDQGAVQEFREENLYESNQ